MKPSQIRPLADEYVSRFMRRLEIGAVEYGNKSFDEPSAKLQKEILEELEDFGVWSFILWTKVHAITDSLEKVSQESVVEDAE